MTVSLKTALLAGSALLFAGLVGFGLARLGAAPGPSAAPLLAVAKPAPSSELALSPDQVRQAGISIETVQAGGFAAEILSQGTVFPTVSGLAVVTAPAGGTVTRILKRLGDPVTTGEAVAWIGGSAGAQVAADRRVAVARSVLADQVRAREKSLFDQGITARADYERAMAEAESARAEADRARIAASRAGVTEGGTAVVVSPISGRITAAGASLGAFVQPETELFRVSDPTKNQVEAQVSAMEAARIAPGDRAVVQAGDGAPIDGHVRSLTPALDPQSRTATVVIEASSAGLISGLGIRVRIFPMGATGDRTLIAVPEEAVQSLDGRNVVFLRTTAGFRPQAVVTGRRSGGRVEILSGLAAGIPIAVRNAFLLKAELGKSAEAE